MGIADSIKDEETTMAIKRPKISGVLNVTEDSFSDGGQFANADVAVAHAEKLWQKGASMIDVGAASSNVNSSNVDVATEISRLEAVVPNLKKRGMKVSVDTFKAETQRWCLDNGVDCINDIQGFPYPEIYDELAEKKDVELIVMHSVQRYGFATEIETDAKKTYEDMLAFFSDRINQLTKAGIDRNRLILDPGMGNFLGKNPETSVYVMRHIKELKNIFGLRVMIAASRKSFLGNISSCDKDKTRPIAERRAAATLSAELFAAREGADWLRSHDVGAIVTAIEVMESLER